MNDIKKLLDVVIPIINENIESIREAYQLGESLAMYNKQQIAVKYAYQQLNKLLPEDFRKDITLSNALYLNSMLEGLLKEKLK